jgi:hypothetical protein
MIAFFINASISLVVSSGCKYSIAEAGSNESLVELSMVFHTKSFRNQNSTQMTNMLDCNEMPEGDDRADHPNINRFQTCSQPPCVIVAR